MSSLCHKARLPERDGPVLRVEQAEERVHYDPKQEPEGRLLATKLAHLSCSHWSGKTLYLSLYRRPSIFAVLLSAFLTIRGPKNRGKPQITREKTLFLAYMWPKLTVLVFSDSKFLRDITTRIAREICTCSEALLFTHDICLCQCVVLWMLQPRRSSHQRNYNQNIWH